MYVRKDLPQDEGGKVHKREGKMLKYLQLESWKVLVEGRGAELTLKNKLL